MNITIKTIAQRAGVSTASVSKALNGYPDIGKGTRERILKISDQLGYTPNALARYLARQKGHAIGLLIPDISTPIYPEIFKGIDSEARRLGFSLLLCDTNGKKDFERSYVRTLMENRARGIIIAPVDNEIDHILNVTRGRIPLIFIGGKVNDSMDNYVSNDNVMGSRLAVEHLVSLGHRHIRMICDNYRTKTKRDRVAGFKAAMESNGLEADASISDGLHPEGMEYGFHETLRLIDTDSMPTAICASSDMVALGVMKAAALRGLRIPEDFSLIGYDDIQFASLPTVNLTTVAQPKFEIGILAVRLLIRAIEEGNSATRHRKIIEPTLVIRNTCTSPNTERHFPPAQGGSP
ncbi:MAG TPA: LacI family transcriptional regulator [Treponema sp.]|nr:MAG: hypothetical protein A2Y36_13605 [Treponema sp. GWA1_62_8]OHE68855.1 MAG: hypothetical protein A2001_12455 [Treponema sp. GWC1_61_84]OHE71197.1 MAG: hypothetical protein A2413_05480 [Treponema sp. RIFOXYC1_FULL_61_9]HCM27032.1 LacI family transcriptional regulator [Treponema sp.]